MAPLQRDDWPSVGFVLLALIVGGAGLGYPLLSLAIHLFAIFLLVQLARSGAWQRFDRSVWLVIAGFAGAFLLALAQLIPLPAGVADAMAGREVAAAITAQLDPGQWRALSLAPDLTLRAAFALFPPLAAFLLVAAAGQQRRLWLLRAIVAVAIAGTLLAFLQVAMGAGAPILFETAHRGFGVGLFVNRNHHAVLLLAAIILVAIPGVVPAARSSSRKADNGLATFAPLGIAGLLALGVLATSSRTALVLLPLCLILHVGIMARGRPFKKWLALCALLYLAGGLLISQTDAARQVLERFAWLREDLRFQYWENTVFAIQSTLPWGTGFGSFGAVYPTVEPLAQVGTLRVNHAHNDVLEVALEGGIPGIALMIFMAVAVGIAAFAGWRGSQEQRPVVAAALGGIGAIIAFTLVDFPLRMEAIACLFGVLIGLLTLPQEKSAAVPSAASRRGSLLIVAPAVLIGALCSASMIGDSLVRWGQPQLAVTIAPWSATAWEADALAAQVSGDTARSRESAARALTLAPLNAGAVRAYGLADIQLGEAQRGAELLLAGGALGWREGILQMWLAEAAMAAGNPMVAAERIDALLRRGLFSEDLVDHLRTVWLEMPGGPEAIAARLVDRPGWRQGLFNAVADDVTQRPREILTLLALLRQHGVSAAPQETALMRWRAADAGNAQLVRQLWASSGGQGELGQGGFDRLSAPLPEGAAPHMWAAPQVPGARISVLEDGGRSGDAIRMNSTGMSGGEILGQSLVLEPGRYELSVYARIDRSGTGDQLSWRVSCGDSTRYSEFAVAQRDPSQRGWQRVVGQFDVPTGCMFQRLALFIKPGERGQISVAFDEMSLRTLRRNNGNDKGTVGQ